MTSTKPTLPDVVIVGAGVIGLALAWELRQCGAAVTLVDRGDPGAATTRVAAGMLAPVAEAAYGEQRLLAMTLESARRYPDFLTRLERSGGSGTGHMPCGSLHIALDRDEAAELRRRHRFLTDQGLAAELLTTSACRDLEPSLATSFSGGMRVPEEAVVDPRRLSAALLGAITDPEQTSGPTVRFVNATVTATLGSDRVTGVRLESGEQIQADATVAATGCWSGSSAEWLPPPDRPPVRPVKGQILELAPPPGAGDGEPLLNGIVATERVYLVPREDGRVIAGATVEEMGFDTAVTAGGVFEILREGYRALPELGEMVLAEAMAGLRPATPDNLPVIGPAPASEGLTLATGHYRNGILLAPLTAQAVTAQLSGEGTPALIAAADPARFDREAGASSAAREPKPQPTTAGVAT